MRTMCTPLPGRRQVSITPAITKVRYLHELRLAKITDALEKDITTRHVFFGIR